MGKRETTAARESRRLRNKKKRNKRQGPEVNPKQALRSQARQKYTEAALNEKMAIYREVMLEISKEYYDGGVQYCVLRAKDKATATVIQEEMARETKPFLELPKEEQTPQVLGEVGDIVQELYEGWIEDGTVVPDSVRVQDIPNGRVYDNGTVEAINRSRDMDIIDMGKRYRTRLQENKQKA